MTPGDPGNGHPDLTPPAYRRPVLTVEELSDAYDRLLARAQENYTLLSDLSLRVDTNHLVMLDCFGQLARMMGGKLVVPEPR